MKSDHRVQDRKNIKYGYGSQQNVIPDRQSGQLSEIGLMRHVSDYGSLSHLIIGNVLLFIPISGNHMGMFFLRSVSVRSGKTADRHHILNVLTIRYAGDVREW